jgi:hypothetical protein
VIASSGDRQRTGGVDLVSTAVGADDGRLDDRCQTPIVPTATGSTVAGTWTIGV